MDLDFLWIICDLHWVNLFEDWEVGIDRILKTIADSPQQNES